MLLNSTSMVLQHEGKCIGQVLDEMPAVSNLKSIGRALGNPLCIGFRTIPGDNLDPLMVA